MVIVVGLVTIADKGVTTRPLTAVHHHTAVAKVGTKHIVPLIIAEMSFFCVTGIRADAKEVYQSCAGIDIERVAL